MDVANPSGIAALAASFTNTNILHEGWCHLQLDVAGAFSCTSCESLWCKLLSMSPESALSHLNGTGSWAVPL